MWRTRGGGRRVDWIGRGGGGRYNRVSGMSQLFFKKYLQDAIRANRKKTTIRRWSRPMLQVGKRAFSPGLGWLAIESVDVVQLDDLGDADAQEDGFVTAQEIKRLLHELYPCHATDQKRWFRIRFHLHEVKSSSKSSADDSSGLFGSV